MRIKLCSECEWMEKPGEYARCRAPQNKVHQQVDLTGFEKPSEDPDDQFKVRYCETHREGTVWIKWWVAYIPPQYCGPQGRWWKPRDKVRPREEG